MSISPVNTLVSKGNILLVEDDVDLLEVTKAILENSGYKVTTASNGKNAQTLLTAESKFNVVVTDIRMPEMNGVDLFHWTKKQAPQLPIIFITGFSELLEAKDAYEMGAAEFLSKPFLPKDLTEAIETAIRGKKVEGVNVDEQFCRIPAVEFTSGSQLKVDIYIRLSPNKYLRVASKGAALAPDRVKLYIQKGLAYLYLRKEDFAVYVGINLKVSRAISATQTGLTSEQRLKMLKHTSEVLLQQTYIEGLDKEKFDSAAEVTNSIVATVLEDNDIGKLLNMLNNHSDHLYAHSLGVSIYAALAAKEIGWGSVTTQFKVSLAGLLHDIGKKDLSKDLLDKSRNDMTREESSIYETHTIRGKELLGLLSHIPTDIAIVAAQHHENLVGRGYPGRLRKEQIHPLARLISVIDRFVELSLKTPFNEPISAHEAIDKMIALSQNDFDPVFLAGLMKVFNYILPMSYQKALESVKRAS